MPSGLSKIKGLFGKKQKSQDDASNSKSPTGKSSTATDPDSLSPTSPTGAPQLAHPNLSSSRINKPRGSASEEQDEDMTAAVLSAGDVSSSQSKENSQPSASPLKENEPIHASEPQHPLTKQRDDTPPTANQPDVSSSRKSNEETTSVATKHSEQPDVSSSGADETSLPLRVPDIIPAPTAAAKKVSDETLPSRRTESSSPAVSELDAAPKGNTSSAPAAANGSAANGSANAKNDTSFEDTTPKATTALSDEVETQESSATTRANNDSLQTPAEPQRKDTPIGPSPTTQTTAVNDAGEREPTTAKLSEQETENAENAEAQAITDASRTPGADSVAKADSETAKSTGDVIKATAANAGAAGHSMGMSATSGPMDDMPAA